MADDELDIGRLLRLGLEEHAPSADFRQRVMDRIAVARTAVELARLIGVAPLGGGVAAGVDDEHDEDTARPPEPDPDDGGEPGESR